MAHPNLRILDSIPGGSYAGGGLAVTPRHRLGLALWALLPRIAIEPC